jgi:hypothetical protein
MTHHLPNFLFCVLKGEREAAVPSPAHLFINDFLPGASLGCHAPIWATPRLGRSADYYIKPVGQDAVEIEFPFE